MTDIPHRMIIMPEDDFDTIAKNTFDNDFTQELIERVRSSHRTTPAPSPSTPNKMNFNGGKCTCDEFFNCHDCRDLLRCNKEHDAEVREKVLGDLIIHFKGFENQRTFQYSAADIIQYLEVFQRMESLRTDKEKP